VLRVGIIGGGAVGKAHANVFRHYCDVRVYDLEPTRATHSMSDVLEQEVLFLCLPTPMNKEGWPVARAVFDTLLAVLRESPCKAAVLKSTLPPAALLDCDSILPGRFIYSPEFLTERSAEYELQQSSSFIFGEKSANLAACHAVRSLFSRRWAGIPQHWTSLQTASLVKYMRNVFFACKVGLMNEFDELARSFQAERDEAMKLFMLDARIGRSHNEVPGHDGQLGFGGSCFLKDVNAFLHMAREQGVRAQIVEAAWHSNVARRGADHIALEFERLKGRAITESITPAEVEKLGQ
jgi:UDPglucose 6-dehydrogenase